MADEKSMMPELTLDPSRTDAVPQLTLDPAAPAAPAPEAAKPEATPVRLDENLLNDAEKQAVEAFSKTIGIILPSSQWDVYENAFHLEIIRGIGQFCNQRRYVNTVITG